MNIVYISTNAADLSDHLPGKTNHEMIHAVQGIL